MASRRILLGEDFPRIAGLLAEAEGDLLVGLVDLKNDSFDFLAGADDVARLRDALGPGHFGDVDEAFDALLDLDERAVGHDVDHMALDGGADGVLGLDVVPGVRGLLLEAEGDALLGEVDVEDHDLDLLSDFEHFLRVRDAAPGHIGDMKESVHAAEVDERAEIGDVLDFALAEFADLHFLQELSAHILAGFFEQFAAGNDDVVAFLVDLEDLEIVFLVDELVDVLDGADIDLGAGEEGFHAVEVDEDAAFDFLLHLAADHAAFAEVGGDLLPGLDEGRLLQADPGLVLFVLEFFQIDVDLIVQIDFFPVLELGVGDEPFGLQTDVDQRAVLALLDDRAGDDRVDLEIGFGLSAQQIFHRQLIVDDDVALLHGCILFLFFAHSGLVPGLVVGLLVSNPPKSPFAFRVVSI